ncbi:MAG TPA: AI-2E family transporter [Elusimicrobiota bacterium]|nr:AI-2E family transporter [Elusimicrobiota bacterium]
MSARERWPGKLLLAIGGILLAYAVVRVAAPFVPVIAAAAIVAVVVFPVYRRLSRAIAGSPAAAAVSAGVCIVLALPLALGAWYAAKESARAYPVVRQAIDEATARGGRPPPWLPGAIGNYLRELDARELLLENLQEIGAWAGRAARKTAERGAALLMDFLVFILCLFLFLRDGEALFKRVNAAVPLSPSVKERISSRARDMIFATVEGVFAVAILQGVLAMIGFALLGVPFPVLLGGLCMAFSPMPFFGSALVWVPVVASVALGGDPGRAALLAGWFALVVGTSDNVVRPILIGTRARLPVGLVVLGALGGIRAFGVLGAFLGPVIAALAVAVIDALLREADDERA